MLTKSDIESIRTAYKSGKGMKSLSKSLGFNVKTIRRHTLDLPRNRLPAKAEKIACERGHLYDETTTQRLGGGRQCSYCKAAGREKAKATGRRQRLKERMASYGITIEVYVDMVAAQNGLCAICNNEAKWKYKRLVVDHDHSTGKVRKLLCENCNAGLGHARDNPALLRSMADYLESFH